MQQNKLSLLGVSLNYFVFCVVQETEDWDNQNYVKISLNAGFSERRSKETEEKIILYLYHIKSEILKIIFISVITANFLSKSENSTREYRVIRFPCPLRGYKKSKILQILKELIIKLIGD